MRPHRNVVLFLSLAAMLVVALAGLRRGRRPSRDGDHHVLGYVRGRVFNG
jgi:hypothetical protein